MIYEVGPIRPPSESKSLLIRVTRGCHWNRCYFCGLYKNITFKVRNIEDIKLDIKKAARANKNNEFSSCFLQDSDALVLKTDMLIEIAETVKESFPSIKYITSYARADSILRKSLPELIALKQAGLNHLYSGMETGSDVILQKINKGVTANQNIEAGLLAKEAGMILSEFILLGIGGKEHSQENAIKTAEALNIIVPDYIRVHATAFKPNTEMGNKIKNGELTLQSEEEIVIEQKLFIQKLNSMNSVYINEHIVPLIMEIRGNLLTDRMKMLDTIEVYLNLSQSDKRNFAVGRRINSYYSLGDMADLNKKEKVENYIRHLQMMNTLNDTDFAQICNFYRSQSI